MCYVSSNKSLKRNSISLNKVMYSLNFTLVRSCMKITKLKKFSVKKERFHSAGYRAQDLSIAGRMLYHLSYGGSTQLFSQNLFTPHVATDKPGTIF